MDKETLVALQGSIKKWEEIVAGTGEDRGPRNCPLCQRFRIRRGELCESCPVKIKTGLTSCKGTPYEDWVDFFGELELTTILTWSPNTVPLEHRDRAIALAQDELDFLKSLLPENSDG